MNVLFCLGEAPELARRMAEAFPSLAFTWAAGSADALTEHVGEAEVLVGTDALFTPRNTAILREHGRRLKWIQITTSGVERALANGLPGHAVVTNATGTYTTSVAEHAIFLMLAVLRRCNEAAVARARREWIRPALMQGITGLDQGTLVIVGLGPVGRDIARKAKAFDMRVIGVSRMSGPVANVDEICPRERLREAMAMADVVAIAASYDPSVRHLVSAEMLAAMKPTAVVVNIARGTLVDEAALIAALQAGRIAGAGLDVTDGEPPPPDSALWHLPNVVLTPHVAAAGGDRFAKLFETIAGNMRRYLAGKPMNNVVLEPAEPPV